MADFDLQIVTPAGTRFDGKATSLSLSTSTGKICILAGHTNYMAAVTIGEAKIETVENIRYAACGNGFLSVKDGVCNLIAGSFDFAENISKEKATLDLEVAKNLLKDATNKADISVAKDKMKLASLRLSVLEHL
jgi:F-type H+-transporting ATPase subunit epsilon